MKLPVAQFWALLRRYLLPQGARVALMTGLLLTGIALQVLNPQLARRFVDGARTGADGSALSWLAVAFIASALVSSGLRALAAYVSNQVAWDATNALRFDLTAHTLRLGMGFHKSRPPGELIERIDGDVNALSGFFSGFFVTLLGNTLLLVGVLVALGLQDWRLGLVFTVYAIFGVFLLMAASRFSQAWQREREQAAQLYGFLGEALTATEDVRGNGAVAWVMRRIKLELQALYAVRLDAGLKGSIVWGVSIGFWTLADVLSYGFGSRLYREGVLTLGAVYMLIHYAWMVAEPIEHFRRQMQELQRAEASINRVRELFAFQPELQDGVRELVGGALDVAFENVGFAYEDGVRVLEDVNFKLQAGSVLGLLGRTGSGKTTLARLVFRFYDAQAGVVRVGPEDVRDLRLASLRSKVALVTQEVQLFQASLRDNLSFFDARITDARLLSALEALGLGDWFFALPEGLDTPLSAGSLSAGEAQLVALARAFLHDPALVILDEASARLDPATEARLEQALDKLLAGRSAIVIAHRLRTVERASHIMVMEAGRVLEFGERGALAANSASRFAQLRRVGLEEVLA